MLHHSNMVDVHLLHTPNTIRYTYHKHQIQYVTAGYVESCRVSRCDNMVSNRDISVM